MFQSDKELTIQEVVHPCLTGWRQRVIEAEQAGKFTDFDIYEAQQWDMCAVGEAHRVYGIEYRDYEPTDKALGKLGVQFVKAVSSKKFSECHSTLDQIENRLAVMLRA